MKKITVQVTVMFHRQTLINYLVEEASIGLSMEAAEAQTDAWLADAAIRHKYHPLFAKKLAEEACDADMVELLIGNVTRASEDVEGILRKALADPDLPTRYRAMIGQVECEKDPEIKHRKKLILAALICAKEVE